jgi:hypothetical protein
MKAIRLLLLTAGLSAMVGALHATTIDYSAMADGLNPSSDYSFSATGGSVVLASKSGISFVGVGSGQAGTEIDGNQSLKVTFASAEQLSSLTFAMLFNGGEYGDNNEIAAAMTSEGDLFELRVVGENAAEWYKNNTFVSAVVGFGTHTGGQGKFVIENPFGTSSVTNFKLYPIDNVVPGRDGSDFGLAAFTTFDLTSVPDSGSVLALMGAAMIGIAAASRRSRR